MFNSTRYKGRRKFREHSLPSTSSPLTSLASDNHCDTQIVIKNERIALFHLKR